MHAERTLSAAPLSNGWQHWNHMHTGHVVLKVAVRSVRDIVKLLIDLGPYREVTPQLIHTHVECAPAYPVSTATFCSLRPPSHLKEKKGSSGTFRSCGRPKQSDPFWL